MRGALLGHRETERDEQLADLAHLVLSVGRDIRLYGHPAIEIIEITELESLVMNHVQRHPGVSPTRICTEVGLRSSNTSAVLRSLAEKGMIERRPNPDDRRSISVHPTAIAAENLRRVRDMWTRFLAPHVDGGFDVAPAVELLRAVENSVAATLGTRSG